VCFTARVDAVISSIGQLRIGPMKQPDAEAIAGWRYEPPYDFYDAPADDDDLALLLDPERRLDRFFSARAGGELMGFFELRSDGDTVVIGLGLRPDLTSRGLGLAFLEQGLRFANQRLQPDRFRLSVAEFNRRAITVYKRAGFVRTRSFSQETNGGVFSFVEMERPA
jgi:[ribosomal protein S18]-alanine N-acetyltransferase